MNKGKLIDADKLKDKIKTRFNHVPYGGILDLINELSEDREDNNKYITFVERVKPPKDRIIKEGKIPIKPNSLKEEEKESEVECNFNIIADAVKAEYLLHRVKWLEIDNAALRKELTEIKLKLKDLSK